MSELQPSFRMGEMSGVACRNEPFYVLRRGVVCCSRTRTNNDDDKKDADERDSLTDHIHGEPISSGLPLRQSFFFSI